MIDPTPPSYTPTSPLPRPDTEIEPPSYDAETDTRIAPLHHAPTTAHTYTFKPKPNVELSLLLNTSYAPSVTSVATSSASSSVAPRQYIPLYYVGVGNVGGEIRLDMKKGMSLRGIYVSVRPRPQAVDTMGVNLLTILASVVGLYSARFFRAYCLGAGSRTSRPEGNTYLHSIVKPALSVAE